MLAVLYFCLTLTNPSYTRFQLSAAQSCMTRDAYTALLCMERFSPGDVLQRFRLGYIFPVCYRVLNQNVVSGRWRDISIPKM
ncbi:hypothetical protein F4679DRAFT_515004 [Xylaria curta]|nr:hypothetical protein F4679DRAFT_515004 [Xylaria curta]